MTFNLEVTVEGDQMLLSCPGLSEALAIRRLLRSAEEPAIATVKHPYAPGRSRVLDSDNFDSDSFVEDHYLPMDVRQFMEA